MGYLLLEGGGEFTGSMNSADLRALALAGGENAAVDIIPAAAAPDNNHHRACQRGVDWFHQLGSNKAMCRLLIDRVSADNKKLAQQLRKSRLVFLLGGFPSHLAKSLQGTRSWRSICAVYNDGGVIAGSSAGAMVLCEKFYDPISQTLQAGLNLLPGMCIVPHHNSTGSGWVKRLRKLQPDYCILGIDEETGIINDAHNGGWTVYGSGAAVLYCQGKVDWYPAGKVISYQVVPSPQLDLQQKKQ